MSDAGSPVLAPFRTKGSLNVNNSGFKVILEWIWNDLVFFDPSVLGFSCVTLFSSGCSWFASIMNAIKKYKLGTKQCCQVYFSAAAEVNNYLAIKNCWGHDEVKIRELSSSLNYSHQPLCPGLVRAGFLCLIGKNMACDNSNNITRAIK